LFFGAFAISSLLGPNGDYLEFSGGGYETLVIGMIEGWAWVKSLDNKAPLYWENLLDFGLYTP